MSALHFGATLNRATTNATIPQSVLHDMERLTTEGAHAKPRGEAGHQKRRLGQRNEQLRAEKPSQPNLPADAGKESSGERAAAPHPPGSPPTSLPPGPPSSPSGSPPVSPFTGLPSNATQSGNGEAPTAGSAPVFSSAQELERDLLRISPQDALLTDVLADKEVSELLIQHSTGTPEQSAGRPMAAIGPPVDEQGLRIGQEPGHGLPFDLPYLTRPTRPLESTSSSPLPPPAQQRMIPDTATMQDTVTVDSTATVDSTPQRQGNTRQGVASDLPVGSSSNVHEPPTSLEGQSSNIASTPQQHALHVALDRMKAARSDVEKYYILRALAVALGAARTESGTINALHAVLLQLERPELSCEEACASSGASLSNFRKWRRRVHLARLNLPPEYRVNDHARHRELEQ